VQDVTRRLVLMRHGNAEQDGTTDFERTLTERGRSDAAGAGSWLAGHGITPDHALVSEATRARETWESAATGAGWDLAPQLDRGLYAAGPETALDIVQTAPDGARTLMVIAHNPTIATCAQMLDDGDGDVDATNAMAMGGYPAGALTVFEYDGAWADLGEGTCRVQAYYSPTGG
jgi:phosphohistidine phosphatase